MSLKISLNYSPNFNSIKRKKNQVKFLIIHYTGMRSEKGAIKRLTKIQSQVSAHYLILRNGKIMNLVPDSYIAWHAGVSKWNKFNLLNKYSLGIEITNPGHQYGYKEFTSKQINSFIKLSKFLIKKYKINKKNVLGHSDVAPYRKKDPGEKFPWKILSKKKIGIWHNLKNKDLFFNRLKITSSVEKKLFLNRLKKFGYPLKTTNQKNDKQYNKLLVKAFQRRYRPELINGIIDKECLIIVSKLTRIKT